MRRDLGLRAAASKAVMPHPRGISLLVLRIVEVLDWWFTPLFALLLALHPARKMSRRLMTVALNPQASLAALLGGSYERAKSEPVDEGSHIVKRRLTALALVLLAMGCSREGQLAETGVFVVRSVCPQVGIPAATGDITLFNPANRTDAAAIDVSATITNLRSTCDDTGPNVISTVTFDVVATRRDVAEARSVVLPYFTVAMQGGTQVVAKRVGNVGLNFAAGSQRAQTSGQATIQVSRAAATLPEEARKELTRRRRPTDADAAIDPLSNPAVRDAVAKATFEHLVGFQLTDAQLRYNATR